MKPPVSFEALDVGYNEPTKPGLSEVVILFAFRIGDRCPGLENNRDRKMT